MERAVTDVRLVWPAVAIAWTLAATVAAATHAHPALRAPIVIGFLVICPGLQVSRLLGIRGVATTLTLACLVSIVIDAAVAGGLVYGGSWSSRLALLVVAIVTLVGALAEITLHRARRLTDVAAQGSP
jgi:hypothetical protein